MTQHRANWNFFPCLLKRCQPCLKLCIIPTSVLKTEISQFELYLPLKLSHLWLCEDNITQMKFLSYKYANIRWLNICNDDIMALVNKAAQLIDTKIKLHCVLSHMRFLCFQHLRVTLFTGNAAPHKLIFPASQTCNETHLKTSCEKLQGLPAVFCQLV